MKKVFGLLLIGIFLVLNYTGNGGQDEPASLDSSKAKGKLFIIGGGSRSDTLKDIMISESNLASGGYAVVLPMSSSNQDTAAYYGILQFSERDYPASAFTFGAGDQVTPARLDSLRNAALIYIPGGVQSRFMDVINKNPEIERAVKDAYRNGALVAGTSAGAAIMSKIMITGDQKKYPEYTPTYYHLEKDNMITEEGMGLLTGAIVDQHFVKRGRNNRLLTAVMEYPDHIGIGIDESTAIVVDGNKIKVVGESQVLVYRNNSGSAITKEGKLGARDIGLDIYLPGDTFTLR
ncbi:cyanophycinase [Balneolaceae bacterium YR4-1]|uniref:Cyanophycinase n=2 Tax=Halalkalibaculum roseum TaxID=2709311 RepID=A0A6M1T655_9BACT|nr:cyanophycinase [Halalkalibaculum roseum]